MNNTLLISEKYLKANSLINDNVDSMFILPAIQIAQDQGLQPLIGTYLFDKLKTMVSDGTINNTANAKYKSLLDNYIAQFLSFKVMADIQIPIAYKMRNSGVVQNYDDHIYSADMRKNSDVITKLIEYYDNKAKFYADRLSDYLIANGNDYPEYLNWRTYADMPSNRDAYNTGIFLGHAHPECHGDIIILK